MKEVPTLRRRAALATFAGSTSATVVASIQAIVLMPLYLSQIGLPLYGAWLASGELLGLMLAFDAGIPNLMIQRVGAALAARDHRVVGAYFGTGLAVLFGFSVLLGLGLFALSIYVPGWMGIRGAEAADLAGSFRIGSIAFCLMLLTYAFQGLARGIQRTGLVHGAGLAGTAAGFVVTAWMLMAGHGLWSIAAGMVVRSGVSLFGCLVFLVWGIDRQTRTSIRFDREAAREYGRHSPSLFVSGLAFMLTNNSQVLFAATILGPASAAIFGITRKAAELAGLFLNAIGNSSYGGFAHLFAEGDRSRARKVYGEIVALYLSVGLALLGAYLAVNPSLVRIWAGPDLFGGVGLSVLIAAATLVSGWFFLEVSLLRATNQHRTSSNALLLYCLFRVPLTILLTLTFGLAGLPLAAIVTSVGFGFAARNKLLSGLPAERAPSFDWIWIWGGRAAVFAAGTAIGWIGTPATWGSVLAAGMATVVGSGLLLLASDPMLDRYRGSFIRLRPRFRT